MKSGLLSTTALCHPEICRDPVTLGSTILGALGVTGASAALTTIVGYAAGFAINLVASYALQALQKRGGEGEQGRLVNSRSTISPEEYVYGEMRKGGTVTYMEGTEENNKYLHLIVVLAAHECESIEEVYVNDEIVTLDSNGFVTGDKWKSKLRIKKYNGSELTADPDLVAESNNVDGQFVGTDYAYLYIRAEDEREVFSGGLPNFTARVRGKKCYDPRDGQTRWTRNLALCLRDYLTSSYGVRATASQVANAMWSTAANVCDEDVALNGGGTEKRYTSDAVIKSTETRRSVLNKFMAACAGTLWYGNEWLFKPGYYTSPVGDLDTSSLRGPVQINPKPRRRQRFNVVRGTFVSAADDYVDTDFSEVRNASFIAADDGHERSLDLTLGYTTSHAAAQRIGTQTLNRSRESVTFVAPFKFADAAQYTVGDVIRFTEPEYGWLNKEFEVKKWKFRFAKDKTPEVEMALQETSAAAHSWSNNETILSSANTQLPSFDTVPPPVIGTFQTQLLRLQGGAELPAVVFDWTQTGAASQVDEYIVEWRDNFAFASNGGVQDYASLTTDRQRDIYDLYIDVLERQPDVDGLAFWDGSASTIAQIRSSLEGSAEASNPVPFTQGTSVDVLQTRILGMEIGKGMDIKVRAVNRLGRISTPSIRSYVVEDDTEALPAPTSVSATVTGASVRLEYTRPTQYASGFPAYDFSEVEVWRHTSATLTVDGNGEPTVGTRIGASSDDFIVDVVPADDANYYYFLRSVDYSGNKGDFTTGQLVNVPADTGSLDGITVIVQKPSVPVFIDAAGAEDYTNTGTRISVYEGNNALNFTTSTSLSAGQWRIFDTDVFAASTTDLDVGTITDGGNDAVVGNHSDFDTVNNNSLTVGYDIQIRRADGSYATTTVMQTVFLSVAGQAGVKGDKGDKGDEGDPGVNSIDVNNTTPAVTLSASADGVVTNYDASGGALYLYEGDSQLTFVGNISATLSAGQWKFTSTTGSTFPVGFITTGGWTDGGAHANFGLASNWDANEPVGRVTWFIQGKRLDGSDFTLSVSRTYAKALTGGDGFKTAVVTLYQASTDPNGPPNDNPVGTGGTTEYTHSTGVLGDFSDARGWSQTMPSLAPGEFLYVIQAASISLRDVDTISDSEWSDPVKQTQPALNSRIVQVFAKDDDDTAPSGPSGTFTFDFTTGQLSGGSLGVWSFEPPTLSPGDRLFVRSAVASSQGTTDTIPVSEFSAATIISRAGEQGPDGDVVYNGNIYFEEFRATSPGDPSATGFNETSGKLTGLTSGWSHEPPTVDLTDTSVQRWSAPYTVRYTEGSGTPTINVGNAVGTIVINTNLASDTFNGTIDASGNITNIGTAGWALSRLTGDAVFNNATFRGDVDILGGASIIGEIDATNLNVDGITLDRDGAELIVKALGIDTNQIANEAVLETEEFYSLGTVTISTTGVDTNVASSSFSDTNVGFLDIWWGFDVRATGGSSGDFTAATIKEVINFNNGITVTRTWSRSFSNNIRQTFGQFFPIGSTTLRGTTTDIDISVEMTFQSDTDVVTEVSRRHIKVIKGKK